MIAFSDEYFFRLQVYSIGEWPQSMQLDSYEERIYSYLLQLVKVEHPRSCLEHFQNLFIFGQYPDSEILSALQQIADVKDAEQFKYFLNRCYHIFVNGWLPHPSDRWAIPQLVDLLETSWQNTSGDSSTHRLSYLIKTFIQTDEYSKLHKLAQKIAQQVVQSNAYWSSYDQHQQPQETIGAEILSVSNDSEQGCQDHPLSNLGYRYSFLSCDNGYSVEERQQLQAKQAGQKEQFSTELYSYFTQSSQRSHRKEQTFGFSQDQRFQPHNPTLLTNTELNTSLSHFTGKVNNSGTYWEGAQDFLKRSSSAPNYRLFKDDLYEYLITSLDPKFRQGQFARSFRDKLQNTLSQRDAQKMSKELLLSTSSKLFDFLVIESPHNSHHTFINLMGNNEAHLVIGLLLKIVMLCQQARFFLEKRFNSLFNHYRDALQKDVRWLIKSLDHLCIAFCTNLDRRDLFLM